MTCNDKDADAVARRLADEREILHDNLYRKSEERRIMDEEDPEC